MISDTSYDGRPGGSSETTEKVGTSILTSLWHHLNRKIAQGC